MSTAARSTRISIRLSDDLHRALTLLADVAQKTESDVVRDALEDYCRRHARFPTCYDVAKKAGLIGCVKGGRGDLSTSPKHMEGFGRE